MRDQLSAIATFRELHASGCFVLPNPWDIGSLIYLEHLGFKALATTSAGFAFSRGLADSVTAVPRDLMLDHIREMVAATSLPVNADFQTGYADEPEGVAESVALCVATGVAGLSIEDAQETGLPAAGSADSKPEPLYEFALAVERIKGARAAIDASGIPVILTGRCEAWLVGVSNPLDVSLQRLVAFADAGADCLYAPGVSKPDEIEAIVKAVSPKPVNVLVSKFNSDLTVARLADLGVRRISVGSALACAAWGGFMRASRGIAETGSFETLSDGAPYAEINDLFRR
ncbi:MAG TPA: isocitrate lyase/phosphoenolpyruvate mutase family protein [Pyrinomonadaceae bacterium]|jgi:2-methylisocitrate lyase-like PEP mutase family enzyme|nr:isocitrate lyase/phosphoenolpyruvate mutase family protein [Pyrinomonadaceae bacterium]